jgi:hypothetical protein
MVDKYKRGYFVADQEFVLGGRQAFSQMVCQQQPIHGCERSHFAIAPGSRANRDLGLFGRMNLGAGPGLKGNSE